MDTLNERTLVYMIFRYGYVGLRTVSRSRKSPHRFYISRDKLEELEHKSEIIVKDICSFAIARRDIAAGTIRMEFTWLKGESDCVAGYQDTIILPYDKMTQYLHESKQQNELVVWKSLSMDDSAKQAKIIFKSGKDLHAALENGIIRRKLIRFLRDQFRWAYTEKIEMHDDFVPYSFFFREIRAGEPGISGGVILHGQEDMKNAYYLLHT